MITHQMHDFEKGRIEYVQRMEVQVQSLTRLVESLQADAKWTPKIGVNMQGVNVNFTLEYCGKRKTIQVPTEFVSQATESDIVTGLVNAFLSDLVADNLRSAFEPSVAQLKHRVHSSANMTTSSLVKSA